MLHNNYDRRPPEIGALGLQDTIPVANANRSSLNFAGAFARIDRIVSKLGRAKGISVVCSIAVEAPLFDGGPIMYRIDLSGAVLRLLFSWIIRRSLPVMNTSPRWLFLNWRTR